MKLIETSPGSGRQADLCWNNTSSKEDDEDDDYNHDYYKDNHHFCVFPPHLPCDFCGCFLKRISCSLEIICFNDEVIQLLSSVQNLFYILCHDSFYIIHLALQI